MERFLKWFLIIYVAVVFAMAGVYFYEIWRVWSVVRP